MFARLTKYGETVNTHDAYKALAVIIMTIDHLGWFIYTDEMWWRAIGRITFPVWFFLAGYSTRSHITRDIIFWAVVIEILATLCLMPIFEINALFTIILCRLILNLMAPRQIIEKRPLEIWLACLIFVPVSLIFMEYGTLGLMYAVMGYCVRHGLNSRQHKAFCALTFISFSLIQIQLFSLDDAQSIVMVALMGLCTWGLYNFKVTPLPQFGSGAINWLTRLMSRYSLEYYVLHRTILMIIAAWSGWELSGLSLSWLPN
ncbi:MAG: conjugal transfer protein TraX [Rickettsiales bacterium]|nr:conjugal transfer protein TraX [Rickettsiales bacterium]